MSRRPVAGAIILSSVLIVFAVRLSGQVVSRSEHVCCAGSFRLDSVLNEVRLPNPEAGKVQLLVVMERRTIPNGRAGGADAPLSFYQREFWEEFPGLSGMSYIIQSDRGAAAVLWQPRSGSYETRKIRGEDTIRLADGSEIIAIGPGAAGNGEANPNVARVWVWAKREVDEQSALKVAAMVREVLGVTAIQLVVGTHPYLWQTAGFPIAVPAFGALGEIGLRESHERRFLDCRGDYPTESLRCYPGGRGRNP
jgi:hypothetical protein